MEQQRFPVEDGAVTCRPVGDRLEVQAALPGPGEGLYRAYLRGESGKQLDLGTLLPQGNGRRLQRSLPIAELKRRGCWPVTGAGVTLSYAFERSQGMNQLPKGWHKSEQAAARFPNDPVLAQAVRELFCPEAETRVIGIRHGEKLYETLLTNEECAHALDLGGFYRVPCDKRDLNYDKYFTQGDQTRNTLTEFNSNNTALLNVEQVKEKLLALPYIQQELAEWEKQA